MKKSLIVTCLAVVAVLGATVLPAQEPAAYITVHYDSVDPAMTKVYEENGKDWVEAFTAAEAGADFAWRGYRSGFTYAWVSDMPNYAYIDGFEERNKAIGEKIGEEKMDELDSGAAGAVLEHHTEIWKYQADMSYAPEGFSAADMKSINVSIDRVKPSKGKEFRQVVKDAVAAMKKIGAPINFFAYSIPFGEGDYGFVTFGESRADLHDGPEFGGLLAEALGPEGSKDIYARYLASVQSSEERDWRILADLSYSPGGMAEEKAMDADTE